MDKRKPRTREGSGSAIHRGGRQLLAVDYLRYSSENQSAASIEDQHEVCRRYIERNGWTSAGCYKDAAVSGASTRMRAGFQRLMVDVEARKFGNEHTISIGCRDRIRFTTRTIPP
jgi:DNA invertase Pin-like site-specific DNA recombinase